eukprot:TRINITY_DN28246_c0_g1_i1.p1 TRINITY_DN28246_c0_g1~~TRINITY_DN28246_c0_g1_i1.p1  ORF type:complete len:159 (-),score=13.23 TRINITY_DN28246_c0_g1_i1:244-720(-)
MTLSVKSCQPLLECELGVPERTVSDAFRRNTPSLLPSVIRGGEEGRGKGIGGGGGGGDCSCGHAPSRAHFSRMPCFGVVNPLTVFSSTLNIRTSDAGNFTFLCTEKLSPCASPGVWYVVCGRGCGCGCVCGVHELLLFPAATPPLTLPQSLHHGTHPG